MRISENYSLKNLNTFGIEAHARYFTEFSSIQELTELINSSLFRSNKILILGGGSNILFTNDFEGLVLKNNIRGINSEIKSNEKVLVRAGAGEVWHDLVKYCVKNGFGGLENLSLIPGTVGASPMQNIGAYGVEIKDVFEELKAIEISSGKIYSFNNEECKFGYRNSIFKNELKGKFVITEVTFRLSTNPQFNTSYGAINSTLQEMGVTELSIKAISDAVCQIRKTKLPDPAEIGNAGSFFKNPEIKIELYEKIKEEHPDIVNYPTTPGMTKVPAGWLIEKCGWKGKTFGEAGVHKNQALVLVNYGNAKGSEIKKISENIKASVADKFGIVLETEVNII